MKKILTSLLFAWVLSGCGSDSDATERLATEQAAVVDLHGFVYLGQMDAGELRVSYGESDVSVDVAASGAFTAQVPMQAIASGNLLLQVRGQLAGRPMTLHSELQGTAALASEAQQNGYQLSYHEVPALYVSAVSEAYYQLPANADGDWMLNYAAAVKLYLDSPLEYSAIDFTALASDELAMREFSQRLSDGGFNSPMATAIAEIEQDELLALNLRDERLYGEFYSGAAVPARFARAALQSALTIHERELSMPIITEDAEGVLAHKHVAAAWNRVGNRLFVEQTEAGVRQRLVEAVLSSEDAAYNALVAKTGDTIFPATVTDYIDNITVVSAQNDEVLLRIDGYAERSGYQFEWQGEQYQIAPLRFNEGVSTQRLWRYDADPQQRYGFEINADSEQIWLLPEARPSGMNPAFQFFADGRFEQVDLTGIPAQPANVAAGRALDAVFAAGRWSLHDDDTLLRLTTEDEQGRHWARDVQLTGSNELGFEAIQRISLQGEAFALISGGAAAVLDGDFGIDWGPIFERYHEPYLASLVNQTSDLWQGDTLRSHPYFGWWLLENGAGTKPAVTCESSDERVGGFCPPQSLNVLGNELLTWQLNEGRRLQIDRYQDFEGECAPGLNVFLCTTERYIVPLTMTDNGDMKGLEWQVYTDDGQQFRSLGPRLMYWRVMEAPELFERPDDSVADPDEPVEPGAEYDGVDAFVAGLDLGTDFAGAQVTLTFGDELTASDSLDESGRGAFDVGLGDYQAMPQQQVLSVSVIHPDTLLPLRQIVTDYTIDMRDDGSRYLNFQLAPTAWTTAHAAWVDKMRLTDPLTPGAVLKANLAISPQYLEDTAVFVQYWLETPQANWNISFNGYEELLEDFNVFYGRVEFYEDLLGEVRQRLLSDPSLVPAMAVNEVAQPDNVYLGLQVMPFGAFRHDVFQYQFDFNDLMVAWIDGDREFQSGSMGYAASIIETPDQRGFEPVDGPRFVYREFDRDHSLDMLIEHLPPNDASVVWNAWLALNDGVFEEITLRRFYDFSQLTNYLATGASHFITSMKHGVSSDSFSFEYDGQVFADLALDRVFETPLYFAQVGQFVDPASEFAIELQRTYVIQGLHGPRLVHFQAGGEVSVESPDVSYDLQDWRVSDDLRVLSTGYFDSNWWNYEAVLPEYGLYRETVTSVIDNNEFRDQYLAFFMSNGPDPGIGHIDAEALFSRLLAGEVLAIDTATHVSHGWGRERLPYANAELLGASPDGFALSYTYLCDEEPIPLGTYCDRQLRVAEGVGLVGGRVELTDEGVTFEGGTFDQGPNVFTLMPLGIHNDVIYAARIERDENGQLQHLEVVTMRLVEVGVQ